MIWVIFLFFIFILVNKQIDSYQNYLEIPIYDCDKKYNKKLKNLKNYKKNSSTIWIRIK